MRWRGRRESTRVEDRRGAGGSRTLRVGGGIGAGGLVLVLLLAWLTGENPLRLLESLGPAEVAVDPGAGVPLPGPGAPGPGTAGDELSSFARVVLADTEDTWTAIFAAAGSPYEPPVLVLYSDLTRSGCGTGSAESGPFYCPRDRKLYLDLSFFDELSGRFGAPGDFAQAYVIAHEVAHHVQNETGILPRIHEAQQRSSEADANALSVRLELHADCLAGVWAFHAHRERALLEPGDMEEGLNAAAAIGDDRLQRMATGRVHPESWTHGSSAQRSHWLRRGMETGDPDACDTFAAGSP